MDQAPSKDVWGHSILARPLTHSLEAETIPEYMSPLLIAPDVWSTLFMDYPASSPAVLSHTSCMNTASWSIYSSTWSLRHHLLEC